MEKGLQATIGNLFSGGLVVPGDLLQLIAITDETDPRNVVELTRRALPEVLGLINSGQGTTGRYFARRGSKFIIAPVPNLGDVLRIDYFATFAPLTLDTSTNVIGDIAPDLIVYGALSYAAAYFADKREGSFEARYQQIYDDLTAQAMRDELTGNAQVSPASYYPSEN